MEIFADSQGKIEYLIEDDGTLYIDFIETYKKQQGHGTRLMNCFLKSVFNRKIHKNIALIASSEHGTPQDILEKFYTGFGFKVIQKNSYGAVMKF